MNTLKMIIYGAALAIFSTTVCMRKDIQEGTILIGGSCLTNSLLSLLKQSPEFLKPRGAKIIESDGQGIQVEFQYEPDENKMSFSIVSCVTYGKVPDMKATSRNMINHLFRILQITEDDFTRALDPKKSAHTVKLRDELTDCEFQKYSTCEGDIRGFVDGDIACPLDEYCKLIEH